MKPKSKKDLYTVECENRDQTCDVLNYIDKTLDRDYAAWKYVTQYEGQNGLLYSDVNHSIGYTLPVISFEEWTDLPDEEFVLPEKWCINGCKELKNYFELNYVKNLSGIYESQYYYIDYEGIWDCSLSKNDMTLITFDQFKEHVLGEEKVQLKLVPVSELKEINPPFDRDGNLNYYKSKPATLGDLETKCGQKIEVNENTEISGKLCDDKKIIGYKIIKPQYKEIAGRIAFSHITDCSSFEFITSKYGVLFTDGCTSHKNLLDAGVMHWFEPVYESSTEEKIMDYLTKKGTKLTKEEAEDIVKLVNEK